MAYRLHCDYERHYLDSKLINNANVDKVRDVTLYIVLQKL